MFSSTTAPGQMRAVISSLGTSSPAVLDQEFDDRKGPVAHWHNHPIDPQFTARQVDFAPARRVAGAWFDGSVPEHWGGMRRFHGASVRERWVGRPARGDPGEVAEIVYIHFGCFNGLNSFAGQYATAMAGRPRIATRGRARSGRAMRPFLAVRAAGRSGLRNTQLNAI